jgi:hypothetical protein
VYWCMDKVLMCWEMTRCAVPVGSDVVDSRVLIEGERNCADLDSMIMRRGKEECKSKHPHSPPNRYLFVLNSVSISL